jgi:hypothetical protein
MAEVCHVFADSVGGLGSGFRGDGECGDGCEVLVVGYGEGVFMGNGARRCWWWDCI